MKKLKVKFNMEGLSDEQKDALKVIQDTAEFEGAVTDKEIADAVAKQLKEAGFSAEKVADLLKEMDSDNPESIQAEVKSLRQQVDTLKAEGKKLAEKAERGRLISDKAFASLQKAIADGRSQFEMEIPASVVKEAAIMTTTNFLTNAPHAGTVEIDRTIYSSPAPEMVIFNRLAKGRTNARTIIWFNRVNEEGGAAFIAEGALKPLKDWERKEETSTSKKVAVRATVTEEALDDVELLEAEINEVLTNEVIQEVADAILNGDGAGENLQGILDKATSYTTTSLDGLVESANRADAIRAGMLQLRLLKFTPTVVFLNPGDAAVLDLTKDSNGNYIKLQIDGVLQRIDVVETTEVDEGNFLLMDERKWRIKIHKGLVLKWGYGTGDFENNRASIIAEMRLHSYINSIDTGAVLYADFDTVIDAINAEATEAEV